MAFILFVYDDGAFALEQKHLSKRSAVFLDEEGVPLRGLLSGDVTRVQNSSTNVTEC